MTGLKCGHESDWSTLCTHDYGEILTNHFP